tara:strand:- start:66 stop:512 length:447 start_codon:yes stop_codon:yes gene_type:complete
MMKGINILTLIFATLFLFGCKQEFEDISSSEKYGHLIGNKYVSIKLLRIHEITMDSNYQKIVDHYTLTKQPGMGGPEVISSADVQVGRGIKIKKVLQCSNCFLGAPIAIVVDLDNDGLKEKIPVLLYGLRFEGPDGKVSLDPEFFKSL